MPGVPQPGTAFQRSNQRKLPGRPMQTDGGVQAHQPSGYVHNPAAIPGSVQSTVEGQQLGRPPVDVGAVQTFLVGHGYNIPVDGKMGPLTKAAINDFHLAPKVRNPHAFNTRYGLAKGGKRTSIIDKPLTGPGGLLDKKGNISKSYEAASLSGDPSAGPPVDLSGLSALSKIAAATGVPIPDSLLGNLQPEVGQTLPTSTADKLAGLQFDAPIHDLGVEKARQPVQGAQDLADIKHWYDQVLGSESTAAERDKAASTAGVGSVRGAVNSIIASLGGSANQGSGLVGAAGADAAGTLGALGTAEDQYHADLAPLLKAEAAGASSRQVARNTSDEQDIQNKLLDQLGLRGQAKAKATMDVNQYNNDVGQQNFKNTLDFLAQKLGIRQYNDSLKQQGFTNQLALEQAKEAAMLTGAKVIGAVTGKAKDHTPKGAFVRTPAATKQSIANGITSTVTNPDGSLKQGWTPQRVRTFLDSQLRSAGWHPMQSPAVRQYRDSILQTLGLA